MADEGFTSTTTEDNQDNQTDDNQNVNQNLNQGDESHQQQFTDQNQQDKAYLIVGERAFKDRGAVVKHVESAQSHIKTLETETASLRTENKTLKDEVTRLQAIVDAIPNNKTSGNEQQTVVPSKDELINGTVQVLNFNNNLTESTRAAKEAYGDNYNNKVNELAGQYGYTIDEVNQLAGNKPAVFKQLFIQKTIKPNNQSHQGSQGDVNTNAVDKNNQNNGVPRKNIMKMRPSERVAYVQQRMEEQAAKG